MLSEHSVLGGYVTLLGSAGAERAAFAHADNAEGVPDVKRRLDPDDVFRPISLPTPR